MCEDGNFKVYVFFTAISECTCAQCHLEEASYECAIHAHAEISKDRDPKPILVNSRSQQDFLGVLMKRVAETLGGK